MKVHANIAVVVADLNASNNERARVEMVRQQVSMRVGGGWLASVREDGERLVAVWLEGCPHRASLRPELAGSNKKSSRRKNCLHMVFVKAEEKMDGKNSCSGQ